MFYLTAKLYTQMTDRILDISEHPARLHFSNGLLVIDAEAGHMTVPITDLAAVIVSHPQVSYTQAVLAELAAENVVFIACDDKHLPIGMLLPLQTHHVQTQIFRAQASATEPIQKRLWQSFVRAKIQSQAHLLLQINNEDAGLKEMIPGVRSGDPTNVEAQAAKRYWNHLWGASFRRNVDALDQNRHLNYGYAILRGMVARSLCAAGMHPSLGIHHRHRNNPYCLADDVMEPFRPLVDHAVWLWDQDHDNTGEFDRDAKLHLLTYMMGRYNTGNESRMLFDILAKTASSLADVFVEKMDYRKFSIPGPLSWVSESP